MIPFSPEFLTTVFPVYGQEDTYFELTGAQWATGCRWSDTKEAIYDREMDRLLLDVPPATEANGWDRRPWHTANETAIANARALVKEVMPRPEFDWYFTARTLRSGYIF